MKKIKDAFTIIELIFVIILLGILGVMGTDIVVRTYENYTFQRDMTDLQSKSKQLLNQISNYLNDSIKFSIAQYNGTDHVAVENILDSDDINTTNYLEWIGKDIESMRGIWSDAQNRVYSGYSGLADIRESNATFIRTTDCNLGVIDQIEESITGVNDVLDGTNTTPRAALYFVYANSAGTVEQRFWENNGSSLFPVSKLPPNSIANDVIELSERPGEISEHYYLSYSAYGLHLENNGDLKLLWNFRPWNGERVTGGASQLLMEDVVSFSFWSESEGTIIRLRVCLSTDFDDNAAPIFCKEAIVLR